MYTEKHLCRLIGNQLSYTASHIKKAKHMLQNKRTVHELYSMFRAAEGGMQKIIYTLFDEALRKHLATRINALLVHPRLSPQQAETLAGIQKNVGNCNLKKLLRHEVTLRGIEKILSALMLLPTNFFEVVL